MKRSNFNYIFFVMVSLTSGMSCKKEFFDKQPLDAISDRTFWKTESDAQLGLVGCYYINQEAFGADEFWKGNSILRLESAAGNASCFYPEINGYTDGTLNSSNGNIAANWTQAYQKIAACNNFLDHIGEVSMDETKKAIWTAEVRTIRAYEYFYMALYFGDVPLVDHVLSVDEANSISRSPRADVFAFAEKDLKESFGVLPKTRPDEENGRITKAAALAILGRIQMFEKKWSDAVTTYKTIVEDGDYIIYQGGFREQFWEANELNKEIILSTQYTSSPEHCNATMQQMFPEANGGWTTYFPYNELVKEYECTDGRTIDESPLYDPNNPYDNRDPRLEHTVFISDRTVFQGITYISRPGVGPDGINTHPTQFTGYLLHKFVDDTFTSGSRFMSGQNFTLIRYAEILLSYLEAQLESGAAIDQSFLDATINKVRGRATVNMPPVTSTDQAELRKIVRRERRVELAFEGLRWYDLIRWDIAAQELHRQFTGMKLTNNPSSYTDYPVDDEGYYLFHKKDFVAGKNELWPIPQSEITINKNLTQNPGY
ncbi:MAG: RagB/SusD family nutrient uptake outer membrane protein [Chitinophagaceae bacterium]|nr:RagB/SusD family nutrient uptake outer membrane protein [Chitinophagaceae bacterium]